MEETLGALDALVSQGKVRYIGCSNYAAWQIVDAAWTAKERQLTRFISAQNRYSVLSRELERELTPAAARFGLGIIPYFPLESGLLSGKYQTGQDFPGFQTRQMGRMGATTFASPDKLEKVAALSRLGERGGTACCNSPWGGW